jgi:hypothetical protein
VNVIILHEGHFVTFRIHFPSRRVFHGLSSFQPVKSCHFSYTFFRFSPTAFQLYESLPAHHRYTGPTCQHRRVLPLCSTSPAGWSLVRRFLLSMSRNGRRKQTEQGGGTGAQTCGIARSILGSVSSRHGSNWHMPILTWGIHTFKKIPLSIFGQGKR